MRFLNNFLEKFYIDVLNLKLKTLNIKLSP